MRENVPRPVAFVTALLLLAVLVAPTAFAGAAASPRAAGNAAKVNARLQKLKGQLAVLSEQVRSLEGQVGAPRTPIGPAGGDLIGVYPNPRIGPNTVGSDELRNESVGGEKVKLNTLTGFNVIDNTIDVADLANNAVSSAKVADDTVAAADLAPDSVRSSELAALTAHVSAGVAISAAGGPKNVEVSCPSGRTLVDGGYAWTDDEANSIIASAPSEAHPNDTWLVRGMVDAGSNTLFAWATCLAA